MLDKTIKLTNIEIKNIIGNNEPETNPTISVDNVIKSLEFAYEATKNVQYLNDIIKLECQIEYNMAV